jgi:hypothetical protein
MPKNHETLFRVNTTGLAALRFLDVRAPPGTLDTALHMKYVKHLKEICSLDFGLKQDHAGTVGAIF